MDGGLPVSNLNEYQFGHRPQYVAGMHEGDKAYPDVYEHPEYYSTGEDYEGEAHRALLRARGNPDHMSWAYRALPADAPSDPSVISKGDWITMSKGYAKLHADMRSEETGKPFRIAARRVPARFIGLTGDYLPEAGYFPDDEDN